MDIIEGRVVLPKAAVKRGLGNIISSMICHMLFNEIRIKRPWAYSISSGLTEYRDIEIVRFFCEVELGKEKEARDIIREIIRELHHRQDLFVRYKKEGIQKLEFYSEGIIEILEGAAFDIMREDRVIPHAEMITNRKGITFDDFLGTINRFFSQERVLLTVITQ